MRRVRVGAQRKLPQRDGPGRNAQEPGNALPLTNGKDLGGGGRGIAKDGDRLLERDSVLAIVGIGLRRIPLELVSHHGNLAAPQNLGAGIELVATPTSTTDSCNRSLRGPRRRSRRVQLELQHRRAAAVRVGPPIRSAAASPTTIPRTRSRCSRPCFPDARPVQDGVLIAIAHTPLELHGLDLRQQ